MARVTASPGLLPAAALDRGDLTPAPAVEIDPAATVFGHARAAKTINTMEEAVGGRDALVGDLLTAPDLSPRMLNLIQLAFDPRFASYDLGWLCAKADITPGEVFLCFRDAAAAKAQLLTLQKVADKIPEIVASLLTQAIDHEDACFICAGTGTVTEVRKAKKGQPPPEPEQIPCKACRGLGLVKVKGDLDVQKIALEVVGVLKKSTAPTVNVNQSSTSNTLNVGRGSPDAVALGGLAQLQQAVSGILFGRDAIRRPAPPPDPVIDAEPLP